MYVCMCVCVCVVPNYATERTTEFFIYSFLWVYFIFQKPRVGGQCSPISHFTLLSIHPTILQQIYNKKMNTHTHTYIYIYLGKVISSQVRGEEGIIGTSKR